MGVLHAGSGSKFTRTCVSRQVDGKIKEIKGPYILTRDKSLSAIFDLLYNEAYTKNQLSKYIEMLPKKLEVMNC